MSKWGKKCHVLLISLTTVKAVMVTNTNVYKCTTNSFHHTITSVAKITQMCWYFRCICFAE